MQLPGARAGGGGGVRDDGDGGGGGSVAVPLLAYGDRSADSPGGAGGGGAGGSSSSLRAWWVRAVGVVDRHKVMALCVAIALPVLLYALFAGNYAPPAPAAKALNQQNARKPDAIYDGKLLDYRDLLLPNTTIGTPDIAGLTALLHSLHNVLHAAARRDTPETFVGVQPKQTAAYMHLGALPWVEHVCETGFGGGHSTVALLYASDVSHSHTFDTHKFSFSPVAATFVNKYFPHRTTLVVGDSRLTVPQYHALHPHVKCNVIHVDGSDKYERVYDDLMAFVPFADCRNVVIVPGVFARSHATHRELDKRSDGPRQAYARARDSGLLTEIGCFEWYEWLDEAEWQFHDGFDDTGRQPTSFCLAYVNVPGCSSAVAAEARAAVQGVVSALHMDKGFTAHIPITIPPPTSGSANTDREFDLFVMRHGGSADGAPTVPAADAAAAAPQAPPPPIAAIVAARLHNGAVLSTQHQQQQHQQQPSRLRTSATSATAGPVPAAAATHQRSAGDVASPTTAPAWSSAAASAQPSLLMFVSGNGAIDLLYGTDLSGLTWQSRTVALPAAKGGGSGSAVTWDTFVSRPCVCYQRHKQKYHMWYSGTDPDGSGGTKGRTGRTSAIGYAISAELPVFTRQKSVPVLTPTYAWERGGIADPFVVWDDKKRHWRMWYSAFSRTDDDDFDAEELEREQAEAAAIAAADAAANAAAAKADAAAGNGNGNGNGNGAGAAATVGLNLNVRLPRDPAPAPAPAPATGVQQPLGSIGYAWSEDGLQWHRRPEPVLRPNPSSRTESRVVSAPYVVQRHGWYIMFYQAQGGPAPEADTDGSGKSRSRKRGAPNGAADDPRAGLWTLHAARSRDGYSHWELSPYNPLVEPVPGAFDSDSVSRVSALLLDDERWSLWFVGVRDGDVETAAVTTSHTLSLFDDSA